MAFVILEGSKGWQYLLRSNFIANPHSWHILSSLMEFLLKLRQWLSVRFLVIISCFCVSGEYMMFPWQVQDLLFPDLWFKLMPFSTNVFSYDMIQQDTFISYHFLQNMNMIPLNLTNLYLDQQLTSKIDHKRHPGMFVEKTPATQPSWWIFSPAGLRRVNGRDGTTQTLLGR